MRRPLLRIVLLLTYAVSCLSQTVDHPLKIGGEVSPPTLVKQVDPHYPVRKLFWKTKDSTVTLDLIVDEHGFPHNVGVKTTGGEKFDKAAIDAVEQWRFKPAQKDGTAVAVALRVEVAFRVE